MSNRREPKCQLKVVSLFCGCGGLDLGFHDEGFDLIYACDHDAAAVECYSRNLDGRVHVRDVTSEQFHSEIDEIGQCDVVLGGFPCQGFSKAGPKKQDDPRNRLYLEMKRAVERLRPKVFVAENVDGLHQNFGGSILQQISREFEELGYNVEHRILQAASYGLPQYRRRIFFVGTLRSDKSMFEWPSPICRIEARNGEFEIDDGDGLEGNLWDAAAGRKLEALGPPVPIGDAIGDLLELGGDVPDHIVLKNEWPAGYADIFRAVKEGQKLCNVRHSPTSVYTWDIPAAFGAVTHDERLILEKISTHRRHKKYGTVPNGNPLSPEVIADLTGIAEVAPLINSLLAKGYLKDVSGKYDLLGAMFCSGLFKRPLWTEPSPTVLTVFDNPRYFLHPRKDRPFSVRECARLQGFPDTFTFCADTSRSSIQSAYRLIGNAVPPPLGRLFAKAVKRLLASELSPLPKVAK